jgi:hypothetical protein
MRILAALVLTIGMSTALGAPDVHASQAASPKEWLLFDSTRTGRSEIYALPAAGRALRQLTFSGGWAPRPSPDGRFILFDRSDGTWIMGPDGRGAKLILRGATQAVWASDSRRIAYVASAGGIRIVNRDGSGRRTLTADDADRAPQWSPDGRAVALVNGETLTVVRSGRRTVLAADVTGAFAWSPNGRQIALRSGSTLALENADGSGRRPLADWYTRETVVGPVWSPKGRYVAYADGALQVVEVTSGEVHGLTGCKLLLPSATEPVWSRGGIIGFVDNHGVMCTSTRRGTPSLRRLEDGRPASRPFGLAWTTPPRGVRYRKAVPAKPAAVVATAAELESKSPIDEIAADGTRVAFRTCHEVGVWTSGARSFIDVRHEWPLCTDYPSTRIWGPVVAGEVAGYGTACCNSGQQASLEIFRLGGQGHASITGPGGAVPEPPRIGFMLGHGPLLVFSIWGRGCNGPGTLCPDPAAQPLWRLPLPFTDGACAGAFGNPAPPCVKISAGPVVPLAIDDSRVVVRTAGGAVVVLDANGRELLSLPLGASEGTAAAIAGSDLVVLVAGALRDYDVATGKLLHEWAMPPVSIGGFCGTFFGRCGTPALRLDDAAQGLAAYILDGRLHLLRLRDGADVVIAHATAAQLEAAGLFYAYEAAYPYVGRVRFVPFDRLPLQ